MTRLSLLLLATIPLLAACNNGVERPADTQAQQSVDGNVAEAERDLSPDEVQADFNLSELPTPEPEALSPADIFGSWAASPSGCTAAAEPPVIVSRSSYEDASGACEISELIESDAGFTASLSCERDGAGGAELLRLQPDGDTLTVRWVARDEPERTLVRCPD